MTANPSFLTIHEQLDAIEPVCIELTRAHNVKDKLAIVNALPVVTQFLKNTPSLHSLVSTCDEDGEFVIKAVLAIGQGAVLFQGLENENHTEDRFQKLVQDLKDIEQFYDIMGGIVGYHLTVLKLLSLKNTPIENLPTVSPTNYQEPEGLDLSKDSPQARKAIRWGIENIGELAEFYPLGGAGDRLHLQEDTHSLPVAQLAFLGRTLLEGLIRDLYGREFMHYKLFGKQHRTPLAIMTSHEKNNHERVIKICAGNGWFGRPQDTFRLFVQPLVPMVTEHGFWAVHGSLQLTLKPGGHGVMWKSALDHGIFAWLEGLRRRKGLVRQINNPAAGFDNGLFALTGLGCNGNKDFGFASCPRVLNTSEGMDVLCERQVEQEYEYCLTNIEYTEFEQKGIQDIPKEPGSPYSRFPANTNILFIDLQAIKRVVERYPLPGVIINMKNKIICWNPNGDKTTQIAGRLESTMQNVADYIVDRFSRRLEEGQRRDLRSFITYNERRKTLSVTKQAYELGNNLIGTPEGCYFELMQNYYDLLSQHCGFSLPPSPSESEYLKHGPSFMVHFHPSLGILYGVIAQKLRNGHLAKGAEWIMEIAEADISNLWLDGSLLIEAEAIMGKKEIDGTLVFDSANCGKCTLINVTVKNKGIDRTKDNVFWKHCVSRSEVLNIKLFGNAEFYAEDVAFEGSLTIEVPDGYRLSAYQKNGQLVYRRHKINKPSWQWSYAFDKDDRIILTKDK